MKGILYTTQGILTVFLILFSGISCLKAQNFLGDVNSNYGGMKSVSLQPASIADSRMAYDIQLAGADFTLWNNYIGVRRSGLLGRELWEDGVNVEDELLVEKDPSGDRRIAGELNFQMPSFMVSLDEKNAIAFSWRWRSMITAHNIDPELAKLSYEGLDWPDLWGQDLENPQLNMQGMSWAEYGFTYSRVLYEGGENFLKGGATLKYLQGMGAGYLYARDLNYNVSNDSILSIYDSDVAYGYSENFDLETGMLTEYGNAGSPSAGLDLGFVYEYRPDYEDYKYEDDDGNMKFRPDKNKYKFRAGFSILDIGRVKFDKSPYSRNFNANVENWNVNGISFNNVRDFSDTVRNRFGQIDDDGEFSMTLPTTFSAQLDYKLHNDFYLNFTSFYSPRNISNEERLKNLNYFSLTPRWDSQWLGAAMPLGINEYGEFNLGLSLRMGPFSIGTQDLSTLLWKDDYMGVNLYASLNIPIPHQDPTEIEPEPEPVPEPEPEPDTPSVEEPDPEPIVEEEPEEEPEERMTPEEAYEYLLENYPDFTLDNLTFYVQVGAFRFAPAPGAFEEIEHLGEIREIDSSDGMTRVIVAEWETLGEAEEIRSEIRDNYDFDAFVTPYHHDERLTVRELKDLVEEHVEQEDEE